MNAPLPPMATDRMREVNGQQMLHPMVDPRLPQATPPLVIDRADGVYIFDIDGKRYLDCVASLWNVNVGHNRAEVKQAIVAQLDRLAYYSTFTNTSNPPALELVDRLLRLFKPENMARVMLSSGGSDAVETAIKLARQYWKLEGRSDRIKILSLKYGYHGVHFGGASANGNPRFRVAYEPLMPGFFQIEAPFLYRNPWGANDEEKLCELALVELDRAIQYQGPGTIAAFMAEPVQGAGGVIVPPAAYWPGVRKILDKYGILLIADEVVTGFGRMGSMSGARAWGVAPDIMAMAKGINSGYVPLGATLINERVTSAWTNAAPGDPMAALMHGYTYSGHALACAAANANLLIVENEDLPGNAATVGAYMQHKLAELSKYSKVGNVRGKGLMAAIELVADTNTREPLAPTHPYSLAVIGTSRQQGALVRASGNLMILSPPLIFTTAHVDQMMGILHTAFEKAETVSS